MAAEFRQLLEAGDVQGLRRAWQKVAPGMPQPETFEQAEITMHLTRTASATVLFKARAYSHRWLVERGLPSQLPDALKPAAERIYPKVATAVGVSVNFRSSALQAAAAEITTAITEAVESCYADNQTDPEFVTKRMAEVRKASMRKLFGRIST